MESNYNQYIKSFKKFEPSAGKIRSQFSTLSQYSTFINNKANEIFFLTVYDDSIDSLQLQNEINELGKTYVKNFVALSKHKL